MSKKFKIMLYCAISIILVVLVVLWFYDPEFEHIKDTNGVDNYSLSTITDKDIIDLDSGPIYESNDHKINDSKMSYSIFSGVMEIYSKDYSDPNLQIDLANLKITEGNLRVVLLVDNKIVHEFKLNETNQSFELNKVSGCVAIRIAGESANFEMEYYVK